MHIVINLAENPEKELKKLLWTTDLHLDAAHKVQLQLFFNTLTTQNPEAILIGGDISNNGEQSLLRLKKIADDFKKPVYFVLGNHDFYHGSIYAIRKKASALAKQTPDLIYLTDSDLIEISPSIALIGHDGWYDGRAGDFINSYVQLNDYLLVDELKNLSQAARLSKLNELGDEAGEYLKKALSEAFKRYPKVILLTHVPPFLASCVHEGLMCDIHWGPHFVSQVTGEALVAIAAQYPDRQLLVLCGHTHAGADVKILPNLRVLTGASELGAPIFQATILYN